MNFPVMQISEKVQSINESHSIYLNNIVSEMSRRGERIISLSLGEVYFNIPRFSIEEIDFERGYHYSDSRGLYELRKLICKYYNKQYDATVNPDTEILISAGSKCLIYMAFQATINLGDEVLIHESAWLSYPEQIRLVGGSS